MIGVSCSPKGVIGGKISVTGTVTNSSPVSSGGFSVGIYLSKDNVITNSDIYLGNRYLDGLKTGGSSTGKTTLILPSSVMPGTYYIGGIADYNNEVGKSSETNNALGYSRKVPIRQAD